ncbi:hypothetical protein UPYG_G00127140 [Umbra pygmaea]|uniref:HSF-type DNA-binding domain-containing protein n=1 Tax=Umbra pygmaea TaxID=75934 RepID=A0ABD0X6B6_UMBPY
MCPFSGPGIRFNGSDSRKGTNHVGNMEMEEAVSPILINPSNFPAKLWRLVNNPENRSIRWDARGEVLIIDQQLFEAELLSPQKKTMDNMDNFKTTNFSSFNRQLNLYGFRKVVQGLGASGINYGSSPTQRILHHFHNPNFKKDHPELLLNLKRLTTKNKAKMEAGLEVNSRPPSYRFHRLMVDGGKDKDNVQKGDKRGSMVDSQLLPPSPYPQYHQSRTQPMKEYDRTPIPPHGWVMRRGDASSPIPLYADKGIPVSVIHRFPSETPRTKQASPTDVHMQQSSLSLANSGPKFNSFFPQHALYRPGYYSPASVCQCGPSGSFDSDCHISHQTSSYSHYSYYQPNCPVGLLYPGNQNQNWESRGDHETKKSDVNLDTVFQIVDDLHHSSPKVQMTTLEHPSLQRPILTTSASSGHHPATHRSICTVTAASQPDSSVNVSSPPQGKAISAAGPQAQQLVKSEVEPVPIDAFKTI